VVILSRILRLPKRTKSSAIRDECLASKRFRGPARLSAAVNRVVMFAMMGELAVSAL